MEGWAQAGGWMLCAVLAVIFAVKRNIPQAPAMGRPILWLHLRVHHGARAAYRQLALEERVTIS